MYVTGQHEIRVQIKFLCCLTLGLHSWTMNNWEWPRIGARAQIRTGLLHPVSSTSTVRALHHTTSLVHVYCMKQFEQFENCLRADLSVFRPTLIIDLLKMCQGNMPVEHSLK